MEEQTKEPKIFTVEADFIKHRVEASYSGDSIAKKTPKVKKPFTYNGSLWIYTVGDGSEYRCYALMPWAGYTGEIRTYTVPEGREHEEYYQSLRHDPNGFYNGMIVKWGKEDYVLVGPEVIFKAEKVEGEPMLPAVVPKKKILPSVKHQQENLQCTLTEAEIAELGRQQARAHSDIEAAEEALKSFSTGIKNKVALAQAVIKSASKKIREGYEWRFVDVTITTDYEGNVVSCTRDDTGVLYHQRPLNTTERQFAMDLEADINIDESASLKDIFPREPGEQDV
jgi:hypothetical protein